MGTKRASHPRRIAVAAGVFLDQVGEPEPVDTFDRHERAPNPRGHPAGDARRVGWLYDLWREGTAGGSDPPAGHPLGCEAALKFGVVVDALVRCRGLMIARRS